MIEFTISRAREVPPHRQLVEQVKVALLTGTLRAGEMLPSIRDLEKSLGVTAAVIRRAYAELAGQGIVTAWHGKGVRINERLTYHGAQALGERYNGSSSNRVGKKGGLRGWKPALGAWPASVRPPSAAHGPSTSTADRWRSCGHCSKATGFRGRS